MIFTKKRYKYWILIEDGSVKQTKQVIVNNKITDIEQLQEIESKLQSGNIITDFKLLSMVKW